MLAFVATIVGVALWVAPSLEERFDRCIALAERAGLLETRHEDAALVCLAAASRRRSGGDESMPVVLPSTTGGTPLIIP